MSGIPISSSNALIFNQVNKTSDTARVIVKFNGKDYTFTINDKRLKSLTDQDLQNKYSEQFVKMIKVAQAVDLKTGETLTQFGEKLKIRGNNNIKYQTYKLSEKTSIKLPANRTHQIEKIKEIYNTEITQTIGGVLSKEIARGAAKVVWIPKIGEQGNNLEKEKALKGKVIYTPVTDGMLNSVFKLKEKEIREEVALQKELIIKSKNKFGSPPAYITVDMNIDETADKFMATAEKAEGDLEKLMKKSDLSPLDAAKLALGYVRGISELASLGYVAGDIKPENALGYSQENSSAYADVGKIVIKLADLGKAQKIKPGEKKLYTGNLPFAAPERNLSEKSDVFGLGMVTLRVLEERIFSKTHKSILDVSVMESNLDYSTEKTRGIESFRKMHPAFTKSRVDFLFPTTSSNQKIQEEAMKTYVDAFKKAFKDQFPDDKISLFIDGYCHLLEQTFKSDPDERPTAQDFKTEYEKLVNILDA